MSSQRTFSKYTVSKMNYNQTWRGSINTDVMDKTDKKTEYKLHATGDWGSGGRVYVALPEGVDPNRSDVKKKYNLM